MAQNYDVGTRAWQPDATEGWVASEVVNKTIEGSKAKLEFQLENGEVRFIIIARLSTFPILQGASQS